MRVTVKHPWRPDHDNGNFIAVIVMCGKVSTLKRAEKEIRAKGIVAGMRYAKPISIGPVSNGGSLKITLKKSLYIGSDLKKEVADLESSVMKWLYSLEKDNGLGK